jgi:hypothetical protein
MAPLLRNSEPVRTLHQRSTMKIFQFVFFFLLIPFLSPAQKPGGKKIYLNKGQDNGTGFTSGYQPGDTIVVRSSLNPWSYIYLGNLKGTAEKPVVVINEGRVELTAGFALEHCQYIKITGSGSPDRYGFRIKGSGGVAMSVYGRSAHIEAERFYVQDCAFGCWVKNEADCDTSINNWVLDDMRIHDFEMHNIRIEGFYLGSTDPNNFSRPKDCNGKQEFHRPSRLGNIKIFNGVIDGTGRPAIMLSNAQVGFSEIYNNRISNVGREYNDQQGTGISIGGYSRAYVHHNTIRNTYTWGIASLGGSGLLRIENNKIDSSGFLDGRSVGWVQNIVIDTRPTKPADSTRFIIRDNQVGACGKAGKHIEIWSTHKTYSHDNIICNNLSKGKPASLGVAPGIKWRNCKGESQFSTAASNGIPPALYYGAGALAIGAMAFILFRKYRRSHGRTTSRLALV